MVLWPSADQPVPPPAPRPVAGPAPACDPTLLVGGAPVGLDAAAQLRALAGRPAVGARLSVLAVPANEGFWAGCGNERVFVQLVGETESPFQVRAGQRLSLTGVLELHGRLFAEGAGVSAEEGAGELRSQGVHLRVRYEELRLE